MKMLPLVPRSVKDLAVRASKTHGGISGSRKATKLAKGRCGLAFAGFAGFAGEWPGDDLL